ncbi:MAG: GNAT family N-acetyltransferase [Chloroflexi bacterium]|nr:GNAT family N-acetyltransferase [Chloroflexota bacterium]
MITIQKTNPRDAAVQRLIVELDAYQSALYPVESNHLDPVDELTKDHVHFVGAFDDKTVFGCGAVKIMPGGYGEIKRMYVAPAARWRGVGKQLIQTLEQFLMDAQVFTARLETGIYQQEALALYAKCGYQVIGPFGDYPDDPLSVFMEKELTPPAPKRLPHPG